MANSMKFQGIFESCYFRVQDGETKGEEPLTYSLLAATPSTLPVCWSLKKSREEVSRIECRVPDTIYLWLGAEKYSCLLGLAETKSGEISRRGKLGGQGLQGFATGTMLTPANMITPTLYPGSRIPGHSVLQ